MGVNPVNIGGNTVRTDEVIEVINPYSGQVAHRVCSAGTKEASEAIDMAENAKSKLFRLPSHERSDLLMRVSRKIKERADELSEVITAECGKPIKESRAEVGRASLTFGIASEEAKRIGGEVIPLDLNVSSEGRWGLTRRFPVGTVFGITPFNFPLNLVAHKVAPAIASGNPVIIRPSSKTPLTSLMLAGIMYDAGLLEGALSIIPCSTDVAGQVLEDERVKVFSFTGSAAVGWSLKERVPQKKTLLELGGNAGVIIDASADLEYAIRRCTVGAFSYAGQICISVQRIYVHEDLYKEFLQGFTDSVGALRLGDPMDAETDIGPVIDKENLLRIQSWIDEALKGGARVVAGGRVRKDLFYEPTILTDVSPDMKVSCMEVFAPVVDVFKIGNFEEGLGAVNDSVYGLQAGVFTSDIKKACMAFEELDVGGVIINDVPTYRVDHMPYGGVKRSGFGREGIRYAIEEMTELKLMVLNLR